MLLRKNYIYVVSSALLLALMFFGVKVLHHEWRASYTILFQQSIYKVNLLGLQFRNIFDGIYRPLVASREKGLPERRLYISQKAQNVLMKDMPANIRKWQRAFMLYPDGRLGKIKVRHRGDNPTNWAFHKKSWRVKLPKNSLIDNTRVFNFTVPQEENQFQNYLPHYVGSLTGVLFPRMNLVELFINDKPQGIYHETEHIDESFLRNNKLMPGNIYKGEQANRERQILISTELYDNPGLWSKLSTFNELPETDFSDLEYVLRLIHQAETSDSSLFLLKRVARYEDWARFSAFQTLIQSWHNAGNANVRLFIDPWTGTIRQIGHDTLALQPLAYYNRGKKLDPVLDHGSEHLLLSIYQRSSDFLAEKYRILYGFVAEELLLRAARHLETKFLAMERSFSRDYFRYEKIYTNDYLTHPATLEYALGLTEKEGMRAEWQQMLKNLQWLQEGLRKKLKSPPTSQWVDGKDSIGLIVRGEVPLNRVTLEFSQGGQLPKSLAWDADGNGRLSEKDISIPFRVEGNEIELAAVWTTNRVLSQKRPPLPRHIRASDVSGSLTSFGADFLSVPTQFQLVADTNLAPVSVRGANFLTGERFLLAPGGESGNTPSRRNIPVVEKKRDPVEVWSNNKVIEGMRLIDGPVRILPGTTLRMKKGASLIFRNQVQVEGNHENPVKIVSYVLEDTWGTVALHGPDTAGSVLSHLIIENGSGASLGNIRYIGMLSVHEAKNVEFQNLTLRKNRKFDDMMHIVYSEDIRLRNCVFEGAFSDGLDVDISTVRIQGCRFSGSGNDAVDLMNSKALIMKTELSHSGDKGVSVGEGSEAVVYNSRLTQNMIGIESKDGSIAYVVNSSLIENDRQINAYQKNWRYGGGGKVVVDKSVFSSVDNSITGDKKSDIKIYDSTFKTGFGAMDKQVKIDSLSDDTGEQKAASTAYQPITAKALQGWGVKGNAGQRGLR
jgi:hypothetical protein